MAKVEKPQVVCRGLQPADYPVVKEIIAASFPQAVQANPEALAAYEREPWYDPAHLLVAVVDGRVVSQMGVRDGLLWCSGTGIPAGLVGTVCTSEPHRGQGIGAQLMRASFARMEDFGLAISYLHTSAERHGFYSRQGYKKAIIESPRQILQLGKLDLDTDRLPEHVEVRPGTPEDAAALHAIYQAHYSQVSGAWSRTLAFWQRRLQQQPKLWSQLLAFRVAGGEQPLAYLALTESGDTGSVSEWACLPGAEDMAMGLLNTTLGEWRNRGIRVAQLTVSTRHPLWLRINELLPEDQTGHSDIHVRVQNRNLFVERIRPLLEMRARAADLRVAIRFAAGGDILEIGSGKPLQLSLAASDLCALVYNGRRLPGLLSEGGITATPDDPEALSLLFPDTAAARCAQDAY
jgi:predicted N-acetyltransferase YhbS